ncbi:hypothetical protein PoB_003917600 [Plakobranchus ocellatus]|uniref:Glutamine amidotransferase type-2 domain-containing protein n=1 Tax=Plakobranchus ocellatus TaxID=259542 RepID=A0AAV4AND2_9GAST|nr:hypothetical protein PoB_003917600 [Plakobranchus ocellatus]
MKPRYVQSQSLTRTAAPTKTLQRYSSQEGKTVFSQIWASLPAKPLLGESWQMIKIKSLLPLVLDKQCRQSTRVGAPRLTQEYNGIRHHKFDSTWSGNSGRFDPTANCSRWFMLHNGPVAYCLTHL